MAAVIRATTRFFHRQTMRCSAVEFCALGL